MARARGQTGAADQGVTRALRLLQPDVGELKTAKSVAAAAAATAAAAAAVVVVVASSEPVVQAGQRGERRRGATSRRLAL